MHRVAAKHSSCTHLPLLVAATTALLTACGAPPQGEDAATEALSVSLPSNNLVTNPSFEQTLNGWYEWHASGSRVWRSDAPNGHYVARVAQVSGTMYSLGTSAALVASIPAGQIYQATAYVEAASSSARGKPVTLILRERNPAGQVTKLWSSPPVNLSGAFQKLTAQASAPTQGNQLDLYILQDSAGAGDAFYADAVAATAGTRPPADAGSPSDAGSPGDAGSVHDAGSAGDAGSAHDAGTGGGSVPDGGQAGDGGGPLLPYSNGTAAPGPGPTNSSGQPWHLVFDDEFNGTSLDTSKWSMGWYPQTPTSITPPVNPTPACFDPANVSVSGGSLNLQMTGPGSYTDETGKTYAYASGQVTTALSGGGGGVHFDFLHGYMEARCSFPGSGSIDNWPAFWATGITTGTPSQWPATGEVDVVEGLGGGAAGHWHGPTPGAPSTDDSFGVNPSSADAFTGWHVFAAEWTSSVITWYYDGVAIGSGTPAQVTTTPMYLLLTYQARSTGTPQPGTMKVDYVRVWQ